MIYDEICPRSLIVMCLRPMQHRDHIHVAGRASFDRFTRLDKAPVDPLKPMLKAHASQRITQTLEAAKNTNSLGRRCESLRKFAHRREIGRARMKGSDSISAHKWRQDATHTKVRYHWITIRAVYPPPARYNENV